SHANLCKHARDGTPTKTVCPANGPGKHLSNGRVKDVPEFQHVLASLCTILRTAPDAVFVSR
ncbi:MAG: hypothetical protein V3U18_08000, partial [Alphaproteobacteria bacterium]